MEIHTQPTAVTADGAGDRCRILLPLSHKHYLPGLLRFAILLAQALPGEVLALHVITPEDSESAQAWAPPAGDAALLESVPHEIVTVQAETVSAGILSVAHRRGCGLILLAWRGYPRSLRNKLGHILDPVVEDAPCDVLLLKGEFVFEPGTPASQRILVATAGGTHAVDAVRLALALARLCQGSVTLVTVQPEDADAEAEAQAQVMLAKVVAEATSDREEAERLVTRKVICADKVAAAIVAAARNHDLVFLGATGDTIVNQLVLGSITERIVQCIAQPVVIVRAYRGLTVFWLRRFWRQVNAVLPALTDDDRLDVYKRIRRGARGTSDFYTLILLSVVIATMGLLLNSGAVIIGAMLVAPLMTPVLALGLGVVMGDIRLLRVAGESTAVGVLLAVLLSVVLARVAPLALLTAEVEARTHPNLFDLTVALAAGAAGAFSIARKNIAAALPGVAIAAALVPPLSVIGISLATARWAAAGGASLLFGTNLVAISFAAAVIYLMLGFFPQAEERKRHTILRRGFFASLALLFVVTLPLAHRQEQDVNRTTLARTLRSSLEEALSEQTNLSLFNFDWDASPGQPITIRVVVLATGAVFPGIVEKIDQAVTKAVGREVDVRLVIIRASELGGTGPPTP
ncbi:MAG: DUF389 domain-containing protein [Ardenticatenaceae bacterium]|nr:DUF389 domain-containing protein [Ardenticatenaceae bacterium]HBY93498.1 hypothetical protein [Chloroflexota bacterium]